MKKNVIIVAGGIGFRMKSSTPKQFMILNNKPIIMHSIDAFLRYDSKINVIIALPQNQIEYWKELCETYKFSVSHTIVNGGETRFESVKHALTKVSDGLVAIHDAVRPLVSQSTISKAFDKAKESGNAIPVIDINESLRIVKDNFSTTVNRDTIKIVQTPQVFVVQEIQSAYKQEYRADFTDDASVFEFYGKMVFLIAGNKENIKITNPNDLAIAQALMNNIEKPDN